MLRRSTIHKFAITAGLLLTLTASWACQKQAPPPTPAPTAAAPVVSAPGTPAPNAKAAEVTPSSNNEVAVLDTSMGRIVIGFFPDVAPNHVANFKKLANEGFYNGTYFHRVIPHFMVQGGDPNTKDKDRSNDGTGGSGTHLKAEFNSKSHLRGTVSAARSANPDSASSQFFICVDPAPHLDGQYSAFGEVLEGMDVVDKIVNVKRDARDNPIEPIYLTKVTIEKRPSK